MWAVGSSADRRRDASPTPGLGGGGGGGWKDCRLVWEDEERQALYTEVQELDREPEPPSLSS